MGVFSTAILANATERLAKFVFLQMTVRPSSVAFVHLHGWIVSALCIEKKNQEIYENLPKN